MSTSGSTWWRTRILSANSLADLRESLSMIVQRIGFRYVVFRGRYPQICSGHHEIRLDNCPEGWFEYCSEHGFATAADPMHHRAMQEATPALVGFTPTSFEVSPSGAAMHTIPIHERDRGVPERSSAMRAGEVL